MTMPGRMKASFNRYSLRETGNTALRILKSAIDQRIVFVVRSKHAYIKDS